LGVWGLGIGDWGIGGLGVGGWGRWMMNDIMGRM